MKLSMRKNGILMAVIALYSLILSLCLWVLSYHLQSRISNLLVAKLEYRNTLSYNLSKFIIAFTIVADNTLLLFPWWTILFYSTASTLKQLYSYVLEQLEQHYSYANAGSNNLSLDGLITLFSTILVDGLITSFPTILEAWARPVIANLCVSFLLFCSSVSITTAVAAPILIFGDANVVTLTVAFFVGIVGSILHLYFFAPRILALFYSVVEQGRYGSEALGIGAAHAEGKMGIRGLLLNILIYVACDYMIKSYQIESAAWTHYLFFLIYWTLLSAGTMMTRY